MFSNSPINADEKYIAYKFNLTTAEIEQVRFFGEKSNPLYHSSSPPLIQVRPTVFTVIDGELCEVKDEAPPGARKPEYSSGIFKLAEAS